MEKHCPTCQCSASPPTYPVTCPLCGVEYGPGYDPDNHRPGSDNCVKRQLARAGKCEHLWVQTPGGVMCDWCHTSKP